MELTNYDTYLPASFRLYLPFGLFASVSTEHIVLIFTYNAIELFSSYMGNSHMCFAGSSCHAQNRISLGSYWFSLWDVEFEDTSSLLALLSSVHTL